MKQIVALTPSEREVLCLSWEQQTGIKFDANDPMFFFYYLTFTNSENTLMSLEKLSSLYNGISALSSNVNNSVTALAKGNNEIYNKSRELQTALDKAVDKIQKCANALPESVKHIVTTEHKVQVGTFWNKFFLGISILMLLVTVVGYVIIEPRYQKITDYDKVKKENKLLWEYYDYMKVNAPNTHSTYYDNKKK